MTTTPYRVRSTVLSIAVALGLSACVTDVRLSGASEAGFMSTAKAIGANLSAADRKGFDQAVARYLAVYYADQRPEDVPANLPDAAAVQGMNASQLVEFVDSALRLPVVVEREPLFPNPMIAQQLLEQHRYELALLTEARERIVENGTNPVDDYPIVDYTLIPPTDDLPVSLDKARIVVRMRNASGFDAYDPRFYLAITRGDEVIFDDVVRPDADSKKDPIGPGVVAEYTFECCDVLTDPVRNADLKLEQQDLDLDLSLVSVRDHRGAEILSTQGYTRFDVARIPLLEACIADIGRNPAGWVPKGLADGGDPCIGTVIEGRSTAAIEAIVKHASGDAEG